MRWPTISKQEKAELIVSLLVCVAALIVGLLIPSSCSHASEMPHAAVKYRGDLVRIAHAEWGLDAPIAVFAAQIHQESEWNPQAVSRVGAKGMGQFMPATARWWCDLQSIAPADCQPANPVWSMRALIGYDRWLSERVHGATEYDQVWAWLRGFNGGLGWWLQEAALVRPAIDHQTIDAACGKARRQAINCAENLGYPRRILTQLQPLYSTWGRGVQA